MKRRGRPPGSDSAATRGRIVATAQRLFADRGYDGLGMQQLAAEVGLGSGALYHHFPSKATLFEAVAHAASERFAREVRTHVLPRTTLNERLHGYLDAYRALFTDEPDALRFLAVATREAATRRHRGDEPAAAFEAGLRPLRELLAVVLDDALAAGELPVADREVAEAIADGFANAISSAVLLHPERFLDILSGYEQLLET